MPAGRAVLLLRRLSTGDSRFKNIGINQSVCNENCVAAPCRRDSGYGRRFSSLLNQNPNHQILTKSISNISIRMASSSSSLEGQHKHTNRLIHEKSPYLLQHAHNPVDWYPWGQEAIDKARAENKLIFLSVGYSTCHWCHVMEKESFENEEVAKIMNENYVNVKVDREERPDIDKIYMLFVVASTGSGGWPMSVFLDPNLRPVTGGTYYPPEDKWGRPGFKTLLRVLANKWKTDKAAFEDAGIHVMDALNRAASLEISDDIPGEKAYLRAVQTFKRSYEPEFGGFGTAPKFPQASIFNFLFHFYARNKSDELGKKCRDMCLHTLTKIANGGIHDHVSSGFARYSTDNDWHVPHFEKMLYDQAQLASAYTDAYLATKDEFYADVVRDIIKYVNRDLSHESGGFYSAEDADSYPYVGAPHKKEGAFCVWEYKEIKTLLGDRNIKDIKYLDIFCEHFSVDETGNIDPSSDPHGELTNKNVLIVYGKKEDLIEKFGLSIEEIDQVLKECIDILYEARQKRPRPHLDSKMLCSWNGLMISGLAQAGQGLGEKAFVDRAITAANFIKEYLYDADSGTLLRSCYRGEDGSVAQTASPIPGFLDDYAFLIRGLLDLYEATLEEGWLQWARELQGVQDRLLWDPAGGAYYTSAQDPALILRLKEDQDGAEPSGNSVSCRNLLRLAALAGESGTGAAGGGGERERDKAGTILRAFASRLTASPAALPEMMAALMLYIDSPTQVVIAGGAQDERTQALVRVVRARLLPGRVLALHAPSTAAGAHCTTSTTSGTSAPESLLSRRGGGEAPAAFVCRRFACSLPVSEPSALAQLLDEPVCPVPAASSAQ